VTDYELSITN